MQKYDNPEVFTIKRFSYDSHSQLVDSIKNKLKKKKIYPDLQHSYDQSNGVLDHFFSEIAKELKKKMGKKSKGAPFYDQPIARKSSLRCL